MMLRQKLFDVLIKDLWGRQVFESRGVNGLSVLHDEVSQHVGMACGTARLHAGVVVFRTLLWCGAVPARIS